MISLQRGLRKRRSAAQTTSAPRCTRLQPSPEAWRAGRASAFVGPVGAATLE